MFGTFIDFFFFLNRRYILENNKMLFPLFSNFVFKNLENTRYNLFKKKTIREVCIKNKLHLIIN